MIMPLSGRAPVKHPGRRLLFALAVSLAGCQAAIHPATRPMDQFAALSLSEPIPIAVLDAEACPPIGWRADTLKQSPTHAHQVWISPDGRTAYGIIHFHLPLPVGRDLSLWGFMNQMRQSEGEATLIDKRFDPQRGCIRFVAEGGLYRIRANLFADGLVGWAVYAGSLRAQPVNENDLAIAVAARENTALGVR